MSAVHELAGRLARLTLVVGKGGVGKTTVASGLAAHLAAAGHRTLLLSTDPASSLGDAIGTALGPAPRAVPNRPRLAAMQLSAESARAAFLARWRDTIVTIVDRGTYLDLDDIAGLVDAALPGADEIFALLEMAALVDLPVGGAERAGYDRIVVDTAPTGHTLRLLALPDTFRALVALLDAMQDKHRFMVRALTHRYAPDRADAFLAEMRASIDALHAVLTDPARGAAILVARAEPVVAAESVRYAGALAVAHVQVEAVVVNAVPARAARAAREVAESLAALDAVARDRPHYLIPLARRAPVGLQEIEAVVAKMGTRDAGRGTRGAAASRKTTRRQPSKRARQGSESASLVPRPASRVSLVFVGGKGGVGKTTASCALAIASANEGRRVLLVSTDPAPSIADALAQPVADAEREVEGVPGLVARQMDAAAAFERFRDEYRSRIDALFDALVGRGMDISTDRAILRDLLALAPPGVDELYALASLGETLDEGRFDTIVVDPAPTGHLLRLLEMPPVALDWTHRLMRLMLKYKDVAGLGDTAQELLDFARRMRALDALLRDPARATMILVALDEPLVRAETARLVSRIGQLGIDVTGVLWNRTVGRPQPLPTDPRVAQFVAPAMERAPIGVAKLRDWSAHWAELSTRDG